MSIDIGDKFVWKEGNTYGIDEVTGIGLGGIEIEIKECTNIQLIGQRCIGMFKTLEDTSKFRRYRGHTDNDPTLGWERAFVEVPLVYPDWATDMAKPYPTMEPECTCDIRQLSSYGCNCPRKEWLDKYATYSRVDKK